MAPPSRNEVFREVTQRLCGDLNISSALEKTREYLATLMPADSLQIIEIDQVAGLVRTVAITASELSNFPTPEDVLRIPRAALTELTRQQRRMGPIVNQLRDIPEFQKMLELYDIPFDVSLVHVELDQGARIAGGVTVSAVGVDRFETKHYEILKGLRVPFTIALSNARRYEQVNQCERAWRKTTANCETSCSSHPARSSESGWAFDG